VPGTNFSAKWTGTLTPPVTGTYTFGLTSDDGSRLIINDQQVIDNWRDQAPNTETAQVALTAGQPVQIEVDYYQGGGGAMVNLGWVLPGSDLIIKAAALAAKSDVAVVYANDFESEGSDLANIDLPGDQNQLIEAVAAREPEHDRRAQHRQRGHHAVAGQGQGSLRGLVPRPAVRQRHRRAAVRRRQPLRQAAGDLPEVARSGTGLDRGAVARP